MRLLKERIAYEELRRRILDQEWQNAERLGWLSESGPPKPLSSRQPELPEGPTIDIEPIPEPKQISGTAGHP